MQTQCSALDYTGLIYIIMTRNLQAVENDENSHKDKNIDYEIKIQQGIGKNLILSLLELILTKKTLMLLRLSIKYLELS